ncbi:Glycerate dehydrogenase [subsurface metagenome]
MTGKTIFKVVDYVEPDLEWENDECGKLGVHFEAYQLKFAPPDEIVRKCRDADFLLVDMTPMTSDILDGLDNVKVIVRHGIGYDKVDVAAATKNGIIVANQATAFCQDVAEHAIMLMFAVYRKLMQQDRFFRNSVRSRNWRYHEIYPVYRLSGKTVGIVGCGKIGSRVLEKLRSFGMNFRVCDPYLPQSRLEELGVRHTPLDETLETSDIVSLHVPVTEETRGFITLDKLSLMKKDAIIVNTARGQIINTSDLIQALKAKTIAGAGLDVHEGEPPPESFGFFDMDNVICTPHFAWYSEEGGKEIRQMIMDDFKAFLNGKPPRHVVNPEVLSSPHLRMNLP